ncbi:hypothetical protein ACWIW6_02725 [Ursidibacter sp. B-7004-1]
MNKSTPKTILVQGQDYLDFRQVITELWQAQSMAEIISSTNVEEIDQIVLQTAVRGIAQFVEKSVMTLEEIGVRTQIEEMGAKND